MKKLLDIIVNFFRRFKIAVALSLAIVVAIIMTIVSVTIYVTSGVSTLDLSRPGYEKVREQIGDSGPSQTFDSTGPVNPEVIDQFLELYHRDTEQLENTNDFQDTNMQDIRERMLQPQSSSGQ